MDITWRINNPSSASTVEDGLIRLMNQGVAVQVISVEIEGERATVVLRYDEKVTCTHAPLMFKLIYALREADKERQLDYLSDR